MPIHHSPSRFCCRLSSKDPVQQVKEFVAEQDSLEAALNTLPVLVSHEICISVLDVARNNVVIPFEVDIAELHERTLVLLSHMKGRRSFHLLGVKLGWICLKIVLHILSCCSLPVRMRRPCYRHRHSMSIAWGRISPLSRHSSACMYRFGTLEPHNHFSHLCEGMRVGICQGPTSDPCLSKTMHHHVTMLCPVNGRIVRQALNKHGVSQILLASRSAWPC